MRAQVNNDGDGIDYSDHFTTTMFFASSMEAFNWAYEIGLRLGFGIKRASNKRVGRNTNFRQDYFVCRMGGRGPVNKDVDSLMRGNTGTAWCKCKFSMKVVELQENKWKLVMRSGFHNHALTLYCDGDRYFAKFDEEELAYIDAQVRAHVRPTIISAGLYQRNPEKSRPNRRQIYNRSQKETDELTHVFMAHPEAVKMFRSYYYVVLIDSTYRTNLYRLPLVEMVGVTPVGKSFVIAYALVKHESEDGYMWVLRKLKALLNDAVQPNAIVTDCEAGLLNAIPIRWLNNAKLAIDSIWIRFHSLMETQHVEIRHSLELSRSRQLTWIQRLFSRLSYKISKNAIIELREEFERGAKMTEDSLMIDCGCVKATTLGLLCACSLHRIARNGSRVPVDVLHAFWRKLEYDGSEAMPACDESRLEELFDEIRNADLSMRSSMFDALYSQIHPDEEDVNEPRVNENPRGRPSRGTRREPSAVEHARVRVRVGRATPQRNSSSQRTPSSTPRYTPTVPVTPSTTPRSTPTVRFTPSSTPRSTQTGPGTPSTTATTSTGSFGTSHCAPLEVDYTIGHSRYFPYLDFLPFWFTEYLEAWYNPSGDGHCGFRVLSHAVRGDQSHFTMARIDLLRKIRSPLYRDHIYGPVRFDAEVARITFMDQIPCGSGHWMDSFDLYGYATMSNWVICCISSWDDQVGQRHWNGSHTYLPLRAPPGVRTPYGVL
ncbi:uncharacterized protein LOC141655239 [Silene latifolia]|uniref:uncharacterized protein LOC141655239 n=1 Tax=Silene latifolia TaxID=37657 RepID=UPI003D77F503